MYIYIYAKMQRCVYRYATMHQQTWPPVPRPRCGRFAKESMSDAQPGAEAFRGLGFRGLGLGFRV